MDAQGRIQHAAVPGIRTCIRHRGGPFERHRPGPGRGCVVPYPLGAGDGGQAGGGGRNLFGEPLTTLRTSGGGADGATIAGIYDAWLPDLAKDQLVAPVPDAIAADTKANWPAGVIGAASIDGTLYGIPNEIDVYALNYNKK